MQFIPLFALLLGMALVRPAQADSERSLRVMTFNVNYANRDHDAALDAIAKADPDVVLLQEITSEWKKQLLARFEKTYPHHAFRLHTRSAGGIAVLSKLPIKSEDVYPSPEHGWFPAQRLVLETSFGEVQVLNVHLRPAIDGGSWIKGFMTTPPLRLKEIRAYWKHMQADLPTIVAGDFNEDASGSALAYLAEHKLSRVPTPGPTTWRYEMHSKTGTHELLKMDIDHVVIDASLAASDPEVIDAGGSDHRPVVVTLKPTS